jgi:hypothetical protein
MDYRFEKHMRRGYTKDLPPWKKLWLRIAIIAAALYLVMRWLRPVR